MNITETKLKGLFTINQRAKEIGEEKREAYFFSEHDRINELNIEQSFLYFVKAVSILDMVKKGEITYKGEHLQVTSNNKLIILDEFESNEGRWNFHLVTDKEFDVKKEYKKFNTGSFADEKEEFKPVGAWTYARFLIKNLFIESKKILVLYEKLLFKSENAVVSKDNWDLLEKEIFACGLGYQVIDRDFGYSTCNGSAEYFWHGQTCEINKIKFFIENISIATLKFYVEEDLFEEQEEDLFEELC